MKNSFLNLFFVLSILTLVASATAQDVPYSIQEINGFPSGGAVIPYGINNRGQVVGGAEKRINRLPYQHAFLWDKTNGIQDLGVLPYASWSYAKAINDFGDVVGIAEKRNYPDLILRGFAWSFLEGLQEINTLAFSNAGAYVGNSEVNCINNLGYTAGNSSYFNEFNIAVWCQGFLGWNQSPANFVMAGVPPFIFRGINTATGINDLNETIGFSTTRFISGAGYIDFRPYLHKYPSNQATDLGTIPANEYGNAVAINNRKQIVGNVWGISDPQYKAVLWSNGSVTELRDQSVSMNIVFAINNESEIIGTLTTGEICMRDEQHGIRKLTDVLPASLGWTIHSARAINDRGQIVGYGVNNGVGKAFVISPNATSFSGWITFEGCRQPVQSITAHFVPLDGREPFTRSYLTNGAGFFCFRNIPAGEYDVKIKGRKWLARKVRVDVQQTMADLQLSVLAGDTNDDNSVDILDLLNLIQRYNTRQSVDANFSDDCDINCDGTNDIQDLLLVISNYNKNGEEL